MRVICGPEHCADELFKKDAINIVLFGNRHKEGEGYIGASIVDTMNKKKLASVSRAWDLLSLALSVVSADKSIKRSDHSRNGWTRVIYLTVSVVEKEFWSSKTKLIEEMLRYLTSDIWYVNFEGDGFLPKPNKRIIKPSEDCISLLSGGLDSLVGTIDLVRSGNEPYIVSQVAEGDKKLQIEMAEKLTGKSRHLQMNYNYRWNQLENVKQRKKSEPSQRSRSMVFLSYGVLAACSLKMYENGDAVTLFVCENGFISINPPLTEARLGSHSTRTTHPIFLDMFQMLLNGAGIRVNVCNPYSQKTKGEMLSECKDQVFLRNVASKTTSCSRFARNGFKHCGKCFPCIIRRAAFERWGEKDKTFYKQKLLKPYGYPNKKYDDVRCAMIAARIVKEEGIEGLFTTNVNYWTMRNAGKIEEMLGRGFDELSVFFASNRLK